MFLKLYNYIAICTLFVFSDKCDYDSGPYIATFTAQQTRVAINISITDDDLFEGIEKFNLVIDPSLPRRVIRVSPYRATVSIEDDEKCK